MTVRLFDYTLEPRGRISAGRTAEVVNNRAIHEVVPGTVVRGALGSAWWGSGDGFAGPDSRGTFDRAFARALRVGPAVPSRGGTPARLVTLTMVRCKYPDPDHPDCIGRWLDTAAFRDVLRACPCGGALDHGRGWELGGSDGVDSWVTPTTRTELKHGAAVDERLFTRNALRRDVVLHGRIRVAADSFAADAMQSLARWLTTPRSLSIGGQRSTLGRCRWTCTEAAEPSVVVDPVGYAVRLTSPAILLDDYGAPTMNLSGAVEAVIAAAGGKGQVARAATRPMTVSGWHGMAGLPKPEEWALSPGSVAVVRDVDDASVRALADGVGVRRAEGYGTVELVGLGSLPTGLTRSEESGGKGAGQPLDLAAEPSSQSPADPADGSATEQASDPVTALLDWVPPDYQDKTIAGVLAYAKLIIARRSKFPSEAAFRGYVQQLTGLPWMRDLSGPTQDAVIELWLSEELASYIPTLERLKGGES